MKRKDEFTFAIWMCFLMIAAVESKHYRGGSIYWNPVDDNPEQVKITYRLGFKLGHVEPGHDDCLMNSKEEGQLLQTNGFLKCDECDNGKDVKMHDLEYVCTDYNEEGEWAIGVNSFINDVPSPQFNISYENCCWVDLVSHERGTGRGWKLAASVDLRRRPDTGRINSSPIAEALPVQFMEKGCSYALQIPAIDPDNDDVRCRWPDMEHECNQANNGACGPTPKARLRKNECTLRFDTRKMAVGWHAVNLIIEDFANETSDVPLSKTSLQFLISVLDSSECNKPRVVSPEAGTCRTIPAKVPFESPLIVSVVPGRTVRSFTTLKPEGMTASEVRPLQSTSTEFYSMLTWTPTAEQIGKHAVCFQASDNYNSSSTMTCMNLNVMNADSIGTLTIEATPSSSPVNVINPERLQFLFSEEIVRPKKSKFITILDSSGIEVFQINVAKRSSDVRFDGRVFEFGLPSDLLPHIDSGYKLVFEAGIVNSKTKCGLGSEPYEWDLQSLGHFSIPDASPQPSSSPVPIHKLTNPTEAITPTNDATTLTPNNPTTPHEGTTKTEYMTPNSNDFTSLSYDVTPQADDVPSGTLSPELPDESPQQSTTRPSIRPTSAVLPAEGRKPPGKLEAPTPGIPPCDPAAVPVCLSSSMTIYVSKNIVGDIDPYRMHLIDASCRGERHNGTHYVIGTGYGMCGTMFERIDVNEDNSYNVMGNVVYLPAAPYTNDSIISREHNIEIRVACAITSEHLTYAEFDTEVKTLIYYESGYGNFNFSLKMYRDEDFKKTFKYSDFPINVRLNERMYFQARSWARSGTELLLDSCRATPTANPFDEVQYTFIQDGCIIDDTVELYPTRFSLRKRFSISAFAFMGHLIQESVFIHCDMRICDVMDPNSKCARSCAVNGRITKRDVPSGGNSSAAYQDTDGPIRLVESYEIEEHGTFHAKADLIQTTMLLIVILMLLTLLAMRIREVTWTSNGSMMKGTNVV